MLSVVAWLEPYEEHGGEVLCPKAAVLLKDRKTRIDAAIER